MKTYRFQSQNRAFTLIELLIIAALISLLSGIAVINAQLVMEKAKTRNTYGDIRTLSDSLTTAHMDMGMWPNIGFLYESGTTMDVLAQGQFLPANFDVLSRPNTDLGVRGKALRDKWNGPYYNSPLARNTFGAGYYAKMELPGLSGQDNWRDWPADPWGNPYVVYLLNLSNNSLDWTKTPFEEANFVAIVVSYGPNRVPGGYATLDEAEQAGNTSYESDIVQAEQYRLYDYVGIEYDTNFHFKMKTFSQIQSGNLFKALHNSEGWRKAGGSGLNYISGNFPGIMDPGSDDIWLPLH